ncbi:MAG TPA: TonB-dependent receptor [Longimicrobiales bacterium]|nr:TonB-dependent receptor [Longimicrobiales bacterium]
MTGCRFVVAAATALLLAPVSGVVLLLAPTAAAAQATPDTAAADPPRPFVEGGPYDKPYQTRLLGRTAIGGYAEAHARWERVDGLREGLGFELKRWNLFTATQVNDHVRIGAELEFEELAEEVTLEFAAIDFIVHPALTLRAGAILAPLGRFNLSHDSPQNEFTDRPLVSTEIIGTALTEVGAGALGRFDWGREARLTYELYAVNGFHDGVIQDSPDGTRIPAGKGNAEDDNSSPAAVGRLAFSPRLGWELGLSAHHGAYNRFSIDGESVAPRNDVTLLALDAQATVAGVELSGEAVRATIDLPAGLRGLFADRQEGLYVQATYRFGRGWIATIPASFFEVGARYDGVDFDADIEGDEVRRGTLGINFRPSEDVALKLNYVRGRERDRFNNAAETAGVLFSIATYF